MCRHRQREYTRSLLIVQQATHLCTPRHTHYIFPSVATRAGKLDTSTHDRLPATTLSPRHKHYQTNSDPAHIKRQLTVTRPTFHLASLDPLLVRLDQPLWPNRFLMLSDSKQTIIMEDKPFTNMFHKIMFRILRCWALQCQMT